MQACRHTADSWMDGGTYGCNDGINHNNNTMLPLSPLLLHTARSPTLTR